MNWLEMSEAEVRAIADPIMDNLMQASTDVDHARHVRDFTDRLKSIVTEDNLRAQCKDYQSKLGYFAEREFVGVFRNESSAAVIWKQKYTKVAGEHIAFLRLISVDGKILVQDVSVTF